MKISLIYTIDEYQNGLTKESVMINAYAKGTPTEISYSISRLLAYSCDKLLVVAYKINPYTLIESHLMSPQDIKNMFGKDIIYALVEKDILGKTRAMELY